MEHALFLHLPHTLTLSTSVGGIDFYENRHTMRNVTQHEFENSSTKSILNLNSNLKWNIRDARGFHSHTKCIKTMENWYKCLFIVVCALHIISLFLHSSFIFLFALFLIRYICHFRIPRASYVVFTLFLIFMTNEYNFVAAIGIEANSKQRKSIKYREKAMKCFVIENFLVVIVYSTEIVCMKRNNRHKRIASKQEKKSIKAPPIDRMWIGRRKNRKDLSK